MCGPRGEQGCTSFPLPPDISGQKKREKDAKAQTAKAMWLPGVNILGTFGRWAFLEIDGSNLHKTKQEIRKLVS